MNIEEIEGIGPAMGAKLKEAGIGTVEKLLAAGASKKGRTELEESTGIAGDKILKFVNHADLIRVKGIGPQFAELLEAAGVDTVKEFKSRNAANLHAKMKEVNDEKNLVNGMPSLGQLEAMIEEAKSMEYLVTH